MCRLHFVIDKLYLANDPESGNLRSDSLKSNSHKGTLCEIDGYQEDNWRYQKVANRQPRSILIWEMSVTCHQSLAVLKLTEPPATT